MVGVGWQYWQRWDSHSDKVPRCLKASCCGLNDSLEKSFYYLKNLCI